MSRLDKPAHLTIRFLFVFFSDCDCDCDCVSVFVKVNQYEYKYWDGNTVYSLETPPSGKYTQCHNCHSGLLTRVSMQLEAAHLTHARMILWRSQIFPPPPDLWSSTPLSLLWHAPSSNAITPPQGAIHPQAAAVQHKRQDISTCSWQEHLARYNVPKAGGRSRPPVGRPAYTHVSRWPPGRLMLTQHLILARTSLYIKQYHRTVRAGPKSLKN